MFAKKLTVLLMAAVMAMSVAAVFVGCAPEEETGDGPGPAQTYEFDFVGTGNYNDGNDYTIHIRGSEEEDTFALTIDELTIFQLDGTYTYVDQKGYKLYFEDVGSQFAYTAYDTETEEFSFRYNLDLGEALGSRRIEFTYSDPDFADVYDGEGLGPTPPTFEGSGWGGYLGQFEIAPATIRCYEDGSAQFTATAVTAVDPKTGTWDYDADTNTYHLYFPPQSFANSNYIQDGKYATVHGQYDVQYSSTSGQTLTDFYTEYDETTGEYTLDVQIVWYIYSWIYFTYTA